MRIGDFCVWIGLVTRQGSSLSRAIGRERESTAETPFNVLVVVA